MSKKCYVVMFGLEHDGYADDWGNKYDEVIGGIFTSKEGAMSFIRDKCPKVCEGKDSIIVGTRYNIVDSDERVYVERKIGCYGWVSYDKYFVWIEKHDLL